MKNAIINGRFMEDRMQGLVRYARELLEALDPIAGNEEITLLVPPTAKDIPHYKNIKILQKGANGGIIWEQTTLRHYLKTHGDSFCVNLCNVSPLFVQPGITAILDIMYKVNPGHYTTIRNKLSRYWHIMQYSYITRHEKKIITISGFCKNEIEKNYPRTKSKIEVIPCAWQHVKKFKESQDWKARYPFLIDKEFYFSLATLSRNKNGKWIINAAKRNPEAVFAIGGKHYETEYDEIPQNVHMLGFISDEDACALMKHCKAFIFPSLYEGFGLPPLEALALGAEVISSNTTSLPEVLLDSVHYIDPENTDVDLNELMKKPVGIRENALNQFSWDKSAEKLMKLIKDTERK